MANFCLLPDKVEAFKKALKEKDIKISDLINMSTEERTKLLEPYAGENAKNVNTLFEQKLVLKNRVLGIKNWASKLGEIGKYSKEGKAAFEKTLQDYQNMQKERIFNPEENQAFLNDLADKRLGTHVTKEEAQKVFDLTQKMDAVKNVNAKMSGVSDEYLRLRGELNNYIESLKPISATKAVVGDINTLARNNLLLNPATPIKTTMGQIVNSSMDYFTRRIGTLSAKGLNDDLVKQANREAWDTFRKTGDNTTLMSSIDDSSKLGEKHNFEDTRGTVTGNKVSKGIEVLTRKAAKISNKVAINIEHNISFTKFYQKAFFDMTNLMSSRIAKDEGLVGEIAKQRAAEIFKDAAKIEPQTEEGKMVRAEAQKQGARITNTNDTLIANISLAVKNELNRYVPHLGDTIIPIAKIPANVLWNGIENSGVGIPIGIKDIAQGFRKIQSADLATKYEGMGQYARGVQTVARTLGTLGAAALIANQLSSSDFRSDNYGSHFVRIGDIWINTEYIAAFSPALAGMMMVKQKGKSGQNITDTVAQYVAGSTEGIKNTAISEINSIVNAITNPSFKKGLGKYLGGLITGRLTPTSIQNLTKDNSPQRLFFGATGVQTDQQVKQADLNAKNTKVTTEDWATSKSKEYAQFVKVRGSTALSDANKKYNAELLRNLPRLQNSKAFQDSTPEQQAADTAKLETAIKTKIFRSYGFKYKALKQRKNLTIQQIINSSQ